MNAFVSNAAATEGLSGVPGTASPSGEHTPGKFPGAGHTQPPRRRRRPIARPRLVDQIEAGPGDDPGSGGWSGGFANQAHWDPARPREWRCWAQSGPTWSAHCGAEVAANDTLGLCQRHRRSLLEADNLTLGVEHGGQGSASPGCQLMTANG